MRPHALALAALIAATLAGCGGGGGSSSRGAAVAPVTSAVGAPTAQITNTAPTAPVTGTHLLTYTLSDPESDLATVTVERSIDGGATWQPATRDVSQGDATRNLATSPTGFSYTFAWDSITDLGAATANVRLRLTPADPSGSGPSVETADFFVDNTTPSAPPPPAPTPPAPPAPTPPAPTPPAPPAPAPPAPPAPALPVVTSIRPTLGVPGRTVWIEGQNFDPNIANNVVRFGSRTARVLVARADQLIVSAPSGAIAGTTSVNVQSNGVLAMGGASFQFLPVATITNVAPASAPVGATITITGADFDDTSSNGVVVRFSGGVSVLTTATSSSQITVTVPTGAQSGSLLVVTHGGTSAAFPFTVGSATPPAPTPPAPPAPTPPAPPAPTPPPAPANSAPQITGITTPAGTPQHTVSLAYTVADADNDNVDVLVEYTVNLTHTWHRATRASSSDPVTGLSAWNSGTGYTFVWNASQDLGVTTAPQAIRFRITPSDGQATGSARYSSFFAVANPASPSLPPSPSNTAPDVLSVGTPAGEQRGLATIPYVVADAQGDAVTVETFYMVDAISGWQRATPAAGSDPTSGVVTNAGGIAYRFIWDAMADLGPRRVNVVFKVQARDAAGVSTGRVTGSFTVNNR